LSPCSRSPQFTARNHHQAFSSKLPCRSYLAHTKTSQHPTSINHSQNPLHHITFTTYKLPPCFTIKPLHFNPHHGKESSSSAQNPSAAVRRHLRRASHLSSRQTQCPAGVALSGFFSAQTKPPVTQAAKQQLTSPDH
jgi:hypothetical protein